MRSTQDNPFYGVIKEFEHWIILFREKQVTLGSLIIMSKELEKESLGSVSAEAWSEFGAVSEFAENIIKQAFGAEKFNYLALMMRDPEVHFHVIPRYSKPILFIDQTFLDPDWPDATKRIAMNLDRKTLRAIEDKILSTASNHKH